MVLAVSLAGLQEEWVIGRGGGGDFAGIRWMAISRRRSDLVLHGAMIAVLIADVHGIFFGKKFLILVEGLFVG